jgi:hypothetical protein
MAGGTISGKRQKKKWHILKENFFPEIFSSLVFYHKRICLLLSNTSLFPCLMTRVFNDFCKDFFDFIAHALILSLLFIIVHL